MWLLLSCGTEEIWIGDYIVLCLGLLRERLGKGACGELLDYCCLTNPSFLFSPLLHLIGLYKDNFIYILLYTFFLINHFSIVYFQHENWAQILGIWQDVQKHSILGMQLYYTSFPLMSHPYRIQWQWKCPFAMQEVSQNNLWKRKDHLWLPWVDSEETKDPNDKWGKVWLCRGPTVPHSPLCLHPPLWFRSPLYVIVITHTCIHWAI